MNLNKDNKIFSAAIEYLHEMLGFVKSYCLAKGIDESVADKIILATEEALVNVIQYSYMDQEKGIIEIICEELENHEKGIKIVIKDQGHPIPFNPQEKANKAAEELPKPIEDRKVGGYGVFLYVQIMDKVEYQRDNGINLLYLIKYI